MYSAGIKLRRLVAPEFKTINWSTCGTNLATPELRAVVKMVFAAASVTVPPNICASTMKETPTDTPAIGSIV